MTLMGYSNSTIFMSQSIEISPNLKRSKTEGSESTVKDLINSMIILHVSFNNQYDQYDNFTNYRQFSPNQQAQLLLTSQIFTVKNMRHLIKTLNNSFANTVQSLRRSLQEADPDVHQIILGEKQRQFTGVNLIASQNYCSNACLSAVGSVLNNKYAQGYPGARYYGGTEQADKVQNLCQDRALKAFNLSNKDWGVNVQALSGSPANMAVYTALLNPYDRIMSLDLPHGGHLSHGFQPGGKKISATSKYFEVFPYHLNESTGVIDYEALHKTALIYRPKLIIAGASSYSRLIDYKKFRQVCDQIGAYLHCDIAHPAGLMAAGEIPSAFEYADTVITTTHKTLRGTRGALIFYRVGSKKDKKGNQIPYDYKTKIDGAVFPGLQGGPHMHTIAGIAVAMGEACSPQFKIYQQQVLRNSKAGCEYLLSKGFKIVSGGTDNHLFVADMRSKGTDGGRVQAVMSQVSISINKNTVPGDKSALIPSGIRIGSAPMTTRGVKQADYIQIMKFIQRATEITNNINKKAKGTKLKDFKDALQSELQKNDLLNLKKQVNAFSADFSVPGGLI